METTVDDIAVVTVTYNSSETIGPFLESFRKFHGNSVPVIVVDNESRDAAETASIVKHWGAIFISAGGNLGYGKGMNLGVSQLDGNIKTVLLTNPDLIFANNVLEVLNMHLSQNPSIGLVGPQILDAEGNIYPSARAFPSLRIGVGHALFSSIWKNNPWTRAYHSGAVDYNQEAFPGWLSGACLAIRRETFTSINGFDESYFMYFEDVDLSFRASKLGWGRKYVPTAKVIHAGSHSTQGNSKRMLEEHHKSAYLYLSRKYGGWYYWPVRASLWAGLKLRLILSKTH